MLGQRPEAASVRKIPDRARIPPCTLTNTYAVRTPSSSTAFFKIFFVEASVVGFVDAAVELLLRAGALDR
jgi:hypothetical protein